MTPLRRFLVLQALLAWQGGFFFYSAVVVPVGGEVLGSGAAQGRVTARVTDWLNLIGVVGLAVTAWDLARTRDPAGWRTAARWWCWAAAGVSQYALFVVHQLLDYYMDPTRTVIVIRPPFYQVHEAYLWASTVQWVAMLGFAWWTAAGVGGRGRGSRRPTPAFTREAPPAGNSSPAAPPAGISADSPPRFDSAAAPHVEFPRTPVP